MSKGPAIISGDKRYAALFFTVMLFCSVFFTVEILRSSEPMGIVNVAKITGLFFVFLLGSFGMYTIFSLRYAYGQGQKTAAQREPFITITEQELICRYPSQGKEEKINWGLVNSIKVMITDEGPYVCDVFFIIGDSRGGGVLIPQDKEESKDVVDRILKFPGFDFETFTTAMGSSENKIFDVWPKMV